MTRGLAILVLLVSAANAALPALLACSESTLPACCRRNGNHHCSMMPSSPDASVPSFAAVRTKCPMYPRASAFGHRDQSAPPPTSRNSSPIELRGLASARAQVSRRIPHSRARQKRGPPSAPVLS